MNIINNAVVAICLTHTAAEAAIKELQQSAFDMKTLPLVERDHNTEENVVDCSNTGDQIKAWEQIGA